MVAFVTHNGPTQVGINSKVFSYLPANCSTRGDCFVTRAMCDLVKGQEIDHSVLLVGHASDPALGDYWTVRKGCRASLLPRARMYCCLRPPDQEQLGHGMGQRRLY